ncbi:hypothetical protein [Streptomyces sp. NPDC060194]|uniref:hypothetical protein n=1 Tax=Streptomyces sp. NPDC060194 TaxID=3347069 RepID=UPI003654C5F1
MTTPPPRVRLAFSPSRPASRQRRVWAFLGGALIWVAAGWLVVALLDRTDIMVRLLLVFAVSLAVFAVVVTWGILLRRRGERRDLP